MQRSHGNFGCLKQIRLKLNLFSRDYPLLDYMIPPTATIFSFYKGHLIYELQTEWLDTDLKIMWL